jgi:outer membrane protein
MRVKILTVVITAIAFQTLLIAASAMQLDLLEAYRLAEENDPLLAAAREQKRARLEQVPRARALIFPHIDFSATANQIWDDTELDNGLPPDGAFPIQAIEGSSSYNTANVGINLRQAIFRQDAFIALRQARLIEGQAEIEFLAARQRLGLQVAEAYFGVVEAEDTVRNVEAELRSVESELGRARGRYELGIGGVIEVNDAEARYAATRANHLQAVSSLRLAMETLRRIVNTPVSGVVGLSSAFSPEVTAPDTPDSWIERAERHSLEVRTAEISLDVARTDVDLARAERYPRIDLIAGVQREYQGENPMTGGIGIESDRASVGIQLTLPLFAGGGISAGVRQSLAQRKAGAHRLSDARRNAALSAQTAFIATEAALEQISALAEALQAVKMAEESTMRGLELGQRTMLDLLNVQRERFEVERNFSTARYQYLFSYLRLMVSIGEPIEQAIEAINTIMGGNS